MEEINKVKGECGRTPYARSLKGESLMGRRWVRVGSSRAQPSSPLRAVNDEDHNHTALWLPGDEIKQRLLGNSHSSWLSGLKAPACSTLLSPRRLRTLHSTLIRRLEEVSRQCLKLLRRPRGALRTHRFHCFTPLPHLQPVNAIHHRTERMDPEGQLAGRLHPGSRPPHHSPEPHRSAMSSPLTTSPK